MSQKKAQLLNPINGNINVSGVVTAAQFVGGGSGLTGVATTDNIQTATEAVFLSGVKITGVTTASGGVVGNLTGNVTGNASGTAGGLTGTPNITVGSVNASSGTFTGNVSIAGTLTYEDVTNVDSVGVVTARTDINLGDSIIHIGDTNTKIRFPAADTFTVETGGAEALRVDSSQNVLIGDTAGGVGKLSTLGTGNHISVIRHSSDTSSANVLFAKYRGSRSSPSTAADGDFLGDLTYYGYNGSSIIKGASINAVLNGTVDGSNMTTDLTFSTTSGNTNSERLRITSAGNVRVPDNGKFTCGAGDDLKIYHNGSVNYLAGDEIRVVNNAVSETMAKFIADGAVELYHNDSKKIETSATGVTVTGTVTDSNGDLRITPISAKSGDYTLVATDTGKTITRTGGNITVPQSMTAGMVVTIINNHNSTMSITKGTGVTLRSTDGSDATKTLAAYGVATVLYIAASEAYLTGTGLS